MNESPQAHCHACCTHQDLVESATMIVTHLDDDSRDRQIVKDAERYLSQQFVAATKLPEIR